MMTDQIRNTGERLRYVSPRMKAVLLAAQQVLCGSERQDILNSTEMEEGDDNW